MRLTEMDYVQRKREVAKLTPELLTDRDKGLPSVYRAFPKLKFKGKASR